MRRYIDFRGEAWAERMDSRMQAARWEACISGMGGDPPLRGVIDTIEEDILFALWQEGWTGLLLPPEGEDIRAQLREAVMQTLAEDAGCLSTSEHTLVERMLIGQGQVQLETVAEMEAAYTLRMRLWCDLGLQDGVPIARLDPAIEDVLPRHLMSPLHQERRARIFILDGMISGLLYLAGYLQDTMPREKFIQEVLREEDSPRAQRLARNFLEASFDTYALGDCTLLLHEALADPGDITCQLAAAGMHEVAELTPGVLAASMNGLLPGESGPDEKMQRVLYGALRPEYETDEASSDLRFLAKQNAPLQTMQEIMASMLVVLPTPHMDTALRELRAQTPRWVIHPGQRTQGVQGLVH